MAIVIIVSTGAATYFNAFVAAAEFVVICLQACCCVSEPLLFTIHSALIYEIKLHKHFVNTGFRKCSTFICHVLLGNQTKVTYKIVMLKLEEYK